MARFGFEIAALTAMVLSSCGGPAVTGYSPSVPVADPGAPKVYRTLDGQVFETAEARSAYLHALNDAREREIYEAELFRQQQYSQSLAGLQAARRQARQSGLDQEIARFERERRRLERALRRAERAEQARLRANTESARLNTEAAKRRAEDALRRSDQKLRRVEREQDRLDSADRTARPTERRRARQSRQDPDLPPDLSGTD